MNQEIDLMTRCSSCGNNYLKSNFHKKLSSKDGSNPNFKICRKKYYEKKIKKNQKRLFRKS